MFRYVIINILFAACALAQTTVTIDTAKTREPISKYIYGQFIEHLGRCIYGGLWAELLEDRKFFYPVTGDSPAWETVTPGTRSFSGGGHPYELLVRSPWIIIGSKDAVSMVRENPYVGDHTPRVTLPVGRRAVGLRQDRIGLAGGKDYTARIVLAGEASAAPIEVSLIWGPGATMRETIFIEELSGEYRKIPLRFHVGNSTDNGRIEIVSRGTGSFLIGTVSLMPADNILGWRSDTVALLKELNSPVYRWPGGNFVSGYDWKDGIGDPDRRPPRKNPAWTGIEHNDVGLHEFMELMREIDSEPFVAVNTGLGGAESARELVEYSNTAIDTPMGKLRAENGHPKPFNIKWWAVGNEMYGNWQLGHMPLSEYVKKHNQVVDVMRSVDDSIEPIAVGQVGEWSEQMLTGSADHMSLLSEHIYWQNRDDLVEHVAQVPERIRRVADAHRGYRRELPSLSGKDIRLAMDEWNFWYGPNDFGELGTRYFLQDGLGIAAGLHEFFRNSDLYFMANYAQTVNVIGAIKTTATAAEFEATGLVLKLYRERFGVTPVEVAGIPEPLDIVAAWNEEKTAVTVAVVNPTEEERLIALDLKGTELTGRGSCWLITGADRWAHNDPGSPRRVDIAETSFTTGAGEVEVAPLSVTLCSLLVQ